MKIFSIALPWQNQCLPLVLGKNLMSQIWKKFHVLLETVNLEDKRSFFCWRHTFRWKNKKTLMHIKDYCPMLKQRNCLTAWPVWKIDFPTFRNYNERKEQAQYFIFSTYLQNTGKHFRKNIPFYLEHIYFLVKRAGWLDTKISYMFDQQPFKKIFVINQKSKQEVKGDIEKRFSERKKPKRCAIKSFNNHFDDVVWNPKLSQW